MAAKPVTVRIGERIKLDDPSGFVTLPDGSVVSCGTYYTVQHEGDFSINGKKYKAAK